MIRRVAVFSMCAALAVVGPGLSYAQDEGPLLPGINMDGPGETSSDLPATSEPAALAPSRLEPVADEPPASPARIVPQTSPTQPTEPVRPGFNSQPERGLAPGASSRPSSRRLPGALPPDAASVRSQQAPVPGDRPEPSARPKWQLPNRAQPNVRPEGLAPQQRPQYQPQPSMRPPVGANPSQVRGAPPGNRKVPPASRPQPQSATSNRWQQPQAKPGLLRVPTKQSQTGVPQAKASNPAYRPGQDPRRVAPGQQRPTPRPTLNGQTPPAKGARPWPESARRPNQTSPSNAPAPPWETIRGG